MSRKRNKNKLKWTIIGSIIIALVLAMTMLQLGENAVYFFTPKEAQARAATLGSQNIKVGGMVKPGSVTWVAKDLALSFVLSNLQDTEINVNHTGTPPDMFKEGQGVVVEGKINPAGDVMSSHRLMVKHSEEYEMPDNHNTQERQLLKESIFKGEKAY